MTKDEIKLMKDQQAKIEEGYKYKVRQLEKELEEARNESSAALETTFATQRENKELRAQIQHLQSALSNDERSFYCEEDISVKPLNYKGGHDNGSI